MSHVGHDKTRNEPARGSPADHAGTIGVEPTVLRDENRATGSASPAEADGHLDHRISMSVYAARCSLAAILGWHLSMVCGLAEPVWSAMSALIISQIGLHETRAYSRERVAGSALGIVVTVAVHAGLASSAPVTLQVGTAVAICALVAYRLPSLRVAMWTCPIVLLPSSHQLAVTGLCIDRGLAVIAGAGVGLLLHWLAHWFSAVCYRGKQARVR